MIPEFDLQGAIREAEKLTSNHKDLENRPIAISLSSQEIMPLATFLSAVMFGRKLGAASLDLAPDVKRRFVEDAVSVFAQKMSDAIGDVPEPKTYLDTTRHELDEVGEFLLLPTSRRGFSGTRNIKDLAGPSFITVGLEFVKSGGVENYDLKRRLAERFLEK